MKEAFVSEVPLKCSSLQKPSKPAALSTQPRSDTDSLAMAHALTVEITRISDVKYVTGPTNAPLLVPTPDGFAVRRLYEHGNLVDDHLELAARASADPLWVPHLISRDGLAAMIVVQPTSNESAVDIAVVDSLVELIGDVEAKGFRLVLVGDTVSSVIGSRALAKSTAALTPVTVLLTGLVLLFLSSSWRQAGLVPSLPGQQ